jgi:superfamily I DNA and/or RNA helicase
LLVDEAGMISSKDIMPALRRSKRSIIVGDPKQLSPIVNMEPAFMDTLKNEYPSDFWEQYSPAKVSAFHRAAGTLTGNKHEIGRGIILDEHRRCAPKIANLFIKVADYTGINVCTAKHDDQPFMNIGAEELMFFDIENHDKTSFSKSNLAEAVVIQRLLTRLEAAGYNLKTDVGIITPYKDQESVLVREFGAKLGETDKSKKIGTIHKFQGVEFKVVIFSTVISRPKDSISFVNQMDMINVAISRAKQCFMVVGDFDKLTMNPGPDNIIGMVASHINSHGKYVSMKKKGE